MQQTYAAPLLLHGQVLLKQHEEQAARAAAAEAGRAEAARKAAEAAGERDLARQMLKGVRAMLGHAEAARASAQTALAQAQAEKAASQVGHPVFLLCVLSNGEGWPIA